MRSISTRLIHSTWLSVVGIVLLATTSAVNAQTAPSSQSQGQVASVVNSAPGKTATPNVPVLKDYRGVKIGMMADEVRGLKLDGLKEGESQDYLALSDRETAQIYYDKNGKVTAISIDYFGDGNAPAPETVLGVDIEAKADGSMYRLMRYPDAGYWVSYNRTAGDKPIVSITMQKM